MESRGRGSLAAAGGFRGSPGRRRGAGGGGVGRQLRGDVGDLRESNHVGKIRPEVGERSRGSRMALAHGAD